MKHAYPFFAPMIVVTTLGSAWTDYAHANPTGGSVVAGQGTINQSGNTTTINQQSQNLSLEWLGFSIASGQTVQFLQPSSSAIALNRVTGNDPSQILGRLSANGQVFLINPNGVLFGRGAQVNVGGLVASTLNISEADFLAGHYRFTAGASSQGGTAAPGDVVNQGTITAASGGSVALLGGQVSNQGTIRAQLGTVALAAGSAMTLDFGGNKLLSVKVDQGAVGALAENRQLLQADGGTVIMTASARDSLLHTVVNNTGVVEARTLQDQSGEIKLLGSPEGGTVNVDGTLDASALNGGNGGDIETSGGHVKVADTAIITTKAPRGQSGTWLIDPPDFTIAASGGDITGAALGANLDNGNVTILSSQGTVNVNGSGDINVNDNVSWNNGTTLTLSAVRNVNVNAIIANANPGNGSAVTLHADSGGACVAGTAVCGTVTFDDINGAYVQADTVNIYYNPAGSNNAAGANGSGPTFANPTDYTADVVGTVSGIANTFILVNDVNQLQAINESAQTKSLNYVFGAQINASATTGWNNGAGFVPLGSQAEQFTGTLDGLGHAITGLTVNLPGTSYVGLFGYASATAVISNLGLAGGSVTGASNVGGLVGWNRGMITNTYSTARVTGTNVQVGGLVGVNQGTLSSSHATGNVSALGYVGGLVGWNNGAVIRDSYATGSVAASSGTNIGAGGLVGYMFGNAVISGSYATGSVSAVAPDAGGLVGAYDSNGLAPLISNSYATGTVHGAVNVGGLVGAKLHSGGAIIDSYATGAVSGSSTLGGLAGAWAGGTIAASFWDTQATGQAVSAGGGIGMTTAQMRTPANFNSATAANGNVNPGWSFAGTWRMYDGRTTPLLESFLTPLTITADNISSTYNGNYSNAGLANAVFSIAGAGSSGHLQGAASAYANDRNAGTYSAGIWSDQQGYDISLRGGSLTITPAPITLTTGNVTKTYDGTTNATGVAMTAGGTMLYGSDSLSGGTFAYADKNAGAGNRTVTASGITINDGDGGNNYIISYANNTTSTITPASITVSGITANSKAYDGTTAATLSTSAATLSGRIGGDDLGVSATGRFADPNAGAAKTVTLSTLSLTGASKNNYVLAGSGNEAAATAAITPGAVTVTAGNQNRAAGAPNPAFALTYQGFVAGQDDSNLTQQPTVSTSAGASSPAGKYAITVSGAMDPNYTFTYVPGILTITGSPPNTSVVSTIDLPGYLGALATTSNVGGIEGPASPEDAFAAETLTPESLAPESLSKLSLEILNGGMKMPAGMP